MYMCIYIYIYIHTYVYTHSDIHIYIISKQARGMARRGEGSRSVQEPRHLNKALVVPHS